MHWTIQLTSLARKLMMLVIEDDITRHQWEDVIEHAERLEAYVELTAIPSGRLREEVVRLVRHADGIAVYVGGILRMTIL